MIETITIKNIATYGDTPETLDVLSQFNYIFGANGTGKTTVSRVIADAAKFPTCRVGWKGGTALEPMVYNRDFVDHNFHQVEELKGVFTLGEEQKDTLAKIEKAKEQSDKLQTKVENLTDQRDGADGAGGKKGELATLEDGLKTKCWAEKQRHDAKLQGAFEGYRGSADKFKAKVLQEVGTNTAKLIPLAELEKTAESVFGETPAIENAVPTIDATDILSHEADPILKKRVIGKDDVDIAAMIKKLGNSDWVREGRAYFEQNDDTCPFCQQDTPEDFAQSLDEYFDETFEADSKAIDDLDTDYKTDASRLQQAIEAIIASPSRFLDIEKLKTENELLATKITLNNQRLAGKKKEASRVVELESLAKVVKSIEALIEAANAEVTKHNKMVKNLSAERSTLTAQVWKFVIEELKADLAAFNPTKDGLNKAIKSMTKQISEAEDEKRKLKSTIRDLEKQTTSVQPTIDGINALLLSFGFQGFRLANASSGTSYKLVRPDGSDAKDTLSEGEKTFITFLYFYHLLKGSDSESGMTTNRIVVFDDPVSSLDSDILFIVSSLIKGLLAEVREPGCHVKQVFVLTHNVYFHKEVTYNPNRKAVAMNEETFWIVRKYDSISKFEKHTTNPIKTSYELLWAELRRDSGTNLTIQNTLRRILENYFKILGGINPDKLCDMFEGKDKLICKSLFSWVNDGSHSAHDDLYISIDDTTVESYLKVFKAIFEKSKHPAHYNMMMDLRSDEVPNVDKV